MRRTRLAAAALALAAVWAAAGVRRVDPSVEFGVLRGAGPGLPRLVERGLTWAPPGLVRLQRLRLAGTERELPGRDVLALVAPDGARFGLKGRVRMAPDPSAWRRLPDTGADATLVEASRVAATPLLRLRDARRDASRAEREFRSELSRQLAELGWRLEDLRLEGLDLPRVPADAAVPLARRRLLLVGLDGADWDLVDPLLAAGRLPNLRRLVENGTRARLLSISPMISPVIWTSVATGVEPIRHGILDFLAPAGSPRAGQPVTNESRKVPAIWNRLSDAGARVGVTAWWASWPSERVNGYVVSDRVAYQLFGFRPEAATGEGKTWPPELWETVRPLVREPADVPWTEVLRYLDGPRREEREFDAAERELLDGLRTLIASGDTYLGAALAARRLGAPPDLEIVYFEGTDTVGHLFMPYRPPRLSGISEARATAFGSVVDRYYETADAHLGRLLEGLGPETTVLVLSDHGFVTDASRPRLTDSRIGHGPAADWHRKFGVLVLSGPDIRAGVRLEEAGVYDVAPTILALFGQPIPESWPGRILAGAIDPAFFERHPVAFREDVEPPASAAAVTAAGIADPAAEDLKAKLESLGYLGGGADRGGPAPALSESNNRGVALLNDGRYAEAEAAFRAGLEASPGHPMLLVNLGSSLRLQGRHAEAAEAFRRALSAPEARRAAGIQLAQMLLDDRDFRGSERAAREVIAAEPEAWEGYNALGLALDRLGDARGAEAAWLRSAKLSLAAAEPRNNLGNLARRRGDGATAERWYRESIEADPYFMGAYNNLALAYQERGDLASAIDLYERALEKSPRNAIVQNNLASVRYAQGDLEEAARLWRGAAESDPKYASPRNNLAGIAIARGNLEEAERWLQEALALDPEYGDARVNLALVHRGRGDDAAARTELARAARDPRARATALLHRGEFELAKGRAGEARIALELLTRETPSLVEGWNLLGEAYRREGRVADAAAAWRKSIELEPNQPNIKIELNKLEM
ncbi:MAG TPA: tetratricopeptide repeat protein [Candidatus Polarisedimenticolaceae bacterium]